MFLFWKLRHYWYIYFCKACIGDVCFMHITNLSWIQVDWKGYNIPTISSSQGYYFPDLCSLVKTLNEKESFWTSLMIPVRKFRVGSIGEAVQGAAFCELAEHELWRIQEVILVLLRLCRLLCIPFTMFNMNFCMACHFYFRTMSISTWTWRMCPKYM